MGTFDAAKVVLAPTMTPKNMPVVKAAKTCVDRASLNDLNPFAKLTPDNSFKGCMNEQTPKEIGAHFANIKEAYNK